MATIVLTAVELIAIVGRAVIEAERTRDAVVEDSKSPGYDRPDLPGVIEGELRTLTQLRATAQMLIRAGLPGAEMTLNDPETAALSKYG